VAGPAGGGSHAGAAGAGRGAAFSQGDQDKGEHLMAYTIACAWRMSAWEGHSHRMHTMQIALHLCVPDDEITGESC